MTKRATDEAFDALHALFVDGMSEELKLNIARAKLPKSHEDYEPLNTKLLGVIRATLKDNGIDVPASSPRFNALVDQLKDMDLDDMQAN